MTTLQEKYKNDIVPQLMKSGRYANIMQVPQVTKVVVNMGISTSVDKDIFKALLDDLARVTGQRPIIRKAKKSISNFKLREGQPVGAKVTLRGKRMYDFVDRLFACTLPRLRDFRGLSTKTFDGRGNYALGLQDQSIFPEINPDRIKKYHGMDICFVTSAGSDPEALELLQLLGMPFARS